MRSTNRLLPLPPTAPPLLLTYLDLVPPVPDGTLGDEISPPVSIVGSSTTTTTTTTTTEEVPIGIL